MSPDATLKNPNPVEHLTEFVLDEILMGEASPEALDHLATCDECNARMDAIAQPIASFREVTLAWAEQRSAAMPVPALAAQALAPVAAEQAVPAESLAEYLSGHLSDAQLDAVLIEGASPAAAAHLADCHPCAARLDAVAQPVASFQAVSLAWSERRSATLPLREESFGRATSRNWGRRYGWVAATAAVVAVLLAVPMHRGHDQPAGPVAANGTPIVSAGTAQPVETASTSKPAPSTSVQTATALPPLTSVPATKDQLRRQRQIDADNQMLAAIDHELDASQATLAAYGVTVSTSPAPSRSRTAVAQD
ncbi:hypothetical protein SAMN05421819_1419 [Bryocella elongata]|uniref:Zinc-finger n=1 Tax=Bryocella elongata TaxID=863522 RepID=A0A1H5W3R2_9BACT|nr:hypothetical protein [Bryocella elongata]SEF93801.1 hypothetical protein SAMN05421819_1419 [Bryocella elongata]